MPLSGKSRDLLWLEKRGIDVIGIEFIESAVLDFFRENKLDWEETVQYGHPCFRVRGRNIRIFVTDFIHFANDSDGQPFDSLFLFTFMGQDEGFLASSSNPIIKIFAKPQYPEIARRSALEGTVIVKVLVGPDGLVKDAVVLQGVHPLLDREALAAARRCTFIPGKQRDIPVKAWMALPFNFRLH